MTARRVFGHGALILVLTLLTQTGGIAWFLALRFRRRLVSFATFYALLWGLAVLLAPLGGRVLIGCSPFDAIATKPLLCAMNRSYGRPELDAVLSDLATDLAHGEAPTRLVLLDLGFPFVSGFPLLPHLSHDDGEKADIALFYTDASGGLSAGTNACASGIFCL